MDNYFLDEPTFTEPSNNSFKVSLKNNIIMRKIRNLEQMGSVFDSGIWDNLLIDEKTAIELAYKYNKVTTKMLMDNTKRGANFSRAILQELSNKNILEWVGSNTKDPKQYYRIRLTNENE